MRTLLIQGAKSVVNSAPTRTDPISDDGQWDVYFGPVQLGRLHERSMRIEDHLGNLERRSARLVTP